MAGDSAKDFIIASKGMDGRKNKQDGEAGGKPDASVHEYSPLELDDIR